MCGPRFFFSQCGLEMVNKSKTRLFYFGFCSSCITSIKSKCLYIFDIISYQIHTKQNHRRYYVTLIKTCVRKNVEKSEHSYTATGNVKWCSHFGKQSGRFLMLIMESPCDPATPLLGIRPRETYIHTKTCT